MSQQYLTVLQPIKGPLILVEHPHPTVVTVTDEHRAKYRGRARMCPTLYTVRRKTCLNNEFEVPQVLALHVNSWLVGFLLATMFTRNP